MSRKKSRKARKQRMHSSARALALPAADIQSEESSSSGVASSIRTRGAHPEPSDDADVEAVTPAPASDPGIEPEPRSLSQLALLSAIESIAPVAVSIAPSIPPEEPGLPEEPALSESPAKSPAVREGAAVSVRTELQTTERQAPSSQDAANEPRDNVTPPPPSEWIEFHDFFATEERGVSPSIDHALSEELDDRPVVTSAQLARRAELRRLVTRVVGGLGIACVLIFGKELLFPPASIEEVAAQLPPQLPLAAAPGEVGASSPPSAAEPSIENVPPPPPITAEPEVEEEEAVSPEASQTRDEAPAPRTAEAKTSGSKDAGNPKGRSTPAHRETKKSLRDDVRQTKATAPAIAKAPVAAAAKAAARAGTAPRPPLPERRAARSTPARPRQDPPAPAPTHPTLPTSAGFPVAP
jgi:hypothetical protein